MSTAAKDIIYIDIDDEITAIIEKVRGANNRIVALVLPKRAAVLQSIVNMKLLKRSSDEAKKHIVLITSEAGLLPLAGAVGLHVAKTLQTKPTIPTAPKIYDSNISVDEDEVDAVEDKPLDASKPIGVLAGGRAAPVDEDEEETIEVDNTEEKVTEELEKPVKKPGNKKLKVPNFNKFRTRLLLGGGALILVLILWYMAAFVMPKATIVIRTDTSSETSDVDFTASPDVTELDLAERIVPSVKEDLVKTDSEKITATGEKDNGTKATGTITVRNCDYSNGFTISSGSTFSSGGQNYVSTRAVTVPEFDGPSSSCTLSDDDEAGQASVPVQAAVAGDSHNAAARTYNVPGIPSSARVDAVGSAMTGGTTKIVKVVSQKDFDDAKAKIEARTNSEVADELTATLEDKDYYVIPESMVVGEPAFVSTPAVGQEATEATITSTITYTMIGVKKDHLKELIRESVKDAVDQDREMIQSTGLDEATLRLTDKQPNGSATGTIQSVVAIGPKLDIEELKKEIAGKKRSEVQDIIGSRPGVQEVDVSYSPFWVFSTPGKTGKITITLEQANSSDDN